MAYRNYNRGGGQAGWSLNRKCELLIKSYPAKAKEMGYSYSMIESGEISGRQVRDELRRYADMAWPNWKWYTRQAVFAEYLFQTGDTSRANVDQAFERISYFLNRPGEEDGPFVFTKNVGYGREPLSRESDFEEIEKKARALFSSVKAEVSKRLDNGEDRRDDNRGDELKDNLSQLENELSGSKEGEDEPPKEDEKKSKLTKVQREVMDYLDWIQNKCRPLFVDHASDGHPVDQWGMRQAIDGAKLIQVGVPVKAIKDSVTMHLPPEVRKALGVTEYDFGSFMPEKREEGMPNIFPMIRAHISAGIPTALIGPKGVGKTTVVEKAAVFYELPSTAISMSGGKSASDFYGVQRVGGDGGIIESMQSRIFRNGGFILYDEMDASDENTLLELNRVVANRRFYNKLLGEEIVLHDNCHLFAAMNTLGTGADRDYVGRNRQDAAAMDRWSAGRIRMTLDADLERAVVLDICGIER